MRSFNYEGKEIKLDFSLGCINDIYVNELEGNFNDLINIAEFQDDMGKVLNISRDILLSGHIYYLFLNDGEEEADKLLEKLKTSRMKASKWLLEVTPTKVIQWVNEDLMPSDLEQPAGVEAKKGKK